MGKLKSGLSVNVPIYDFKKHQRSSEDFRKVPTIPLRKIFHLDWITLAIQFYQKSFYFLELVFSSYTWLQFMFLLVATKFKILGARIG